MTKTIVINDRFCGPPDSGNGGYTCGCLAAFLEPSAEKDAVEVTLLSPPPLNQALAVRITEAGGELLAGATPVARARTVELQQDIPEPVTVSQAHDMALCYTGLKNHVFPRCFVCGPEREERDGLRIFAGPSDNSELVAAPWTADASLAGPDAIVKPEFIWAALDCPGYFAFGHGKPMLLGRFTVKIIKPLSVNQQAVVTGWPIAVERRKHTAGTAVYADGELLAYGQAVWIMIK